jgi:hypothetical protein
VDSASNWRRSLALVRLCEGRLRDGYLGRIAAFYGWGVALSYAVLVMLAPASSGALLRDALMTLAGVVGTLVALATMRDFATPAAADGVGALAREMGTSGAELRAARLGAALMRWLTSAGRPALALATLVLITRLVRGAE